MKTKLTIMLLAFVMAAFAAQAQTPIKIGYTNSEYILWIQTGLVQSCEFIV